MCYYNISLTAIVMLFFAAGPGRRSLKIAAMWLEGPVPYRGDDMERAQEGGRIGGGGLDWKRIGREKGMRLDTEM